MNGGRCTLSSINSNPICECSNGYLGERCELSWNPCTGVKCLNSGTCKIASSGNGVLCSCTSEYHGEMCELKRLPCERSPCLNDGTCRNTHSSFRCRCRAGYHGRRCQKEMEFTPNNPITVTSTVSTPKYETETHFITTHLDTNGFSVFSRGNELASIQALFMIYLTVSCYFLLTFQL